MNITVRGLGKQYNFDWIFRNLEYTFTQNSACAIIGYNGSGKSTLAKVIASYTPQTEGEILYEVDGKSIENTEVYKYINFAAPYLELMEDFTLKEHFDFHKKFRNTLINFDEFIEKLKLSNAVNKQIKFFSSGMKQRIKLGFSFFFECKMIILDEPTSNLDVQGAKWYKDEILNIIGKKIIIVCSNQESEYEFCKNYLDLEKLK